MADLKLVNPAPEPEATQAETPSPEFALAVEAAETVQTADAAIAIKSEHDYVRAAGIMRDAAALRKRLVAFFAPLKAAANEAARRVREAEASLVDPVADAEKRLKTAMANYQAAALEADRKAREAARLEDERNVSVAIAEAKAANQPVVIPPPVAPPAPAVPKVKGVSFREVWKARVVDVNLIPRQYMVPDMVALNDMARAFKGDASVPGVEFYSENVVASR